MAKKITIDLSIIVSILIGIIVLLGVYIIVQKNDSKQVSFAVPEVTEEIIYQPYREPVLIQQPTYFSPIERDYGRGNVNMYNIDMKGFKENFSLTDYIQPTNSPTVENKNTLLPSIQPSQPVSMILNEVPNNVKPMESHSDSVTVV